MHTTAIIICIIGSCIINSLYAELNIQIMIVQNYNMQWRDLQGATYKIN